jgi:hypothetical protein
MNHLVAKTKGRKGDFFKILSDTSIFSLPDDLKNFKPYEPDYKLEDEEWFSIQDFSTKEFCIPFLRKMFISTEYPQIKVSEYVNIDYLCSIQDDKYFFQKMAANQLIKKKWFSVSNSPTLVKDEEIILINNFADAIYDKTNDVLYFKKLASISAIFKGIEILYREATYDETKQFLEFDFIKLAKGYNVDSVKTANRKRIAMAMDTLSKFTKDEKKSVFKYIHEYCKNLTFNRNSFSIETEDDLKQVLYGIEQRYYTTPLGNEKRLANSITKIE